MEAIRPYFKIIYSGKNITEDISQHIKSITYTDKVSGESDELQLQLEDKDLKWQNEWYPEKGSKLSAVIGFNDGHVINCGDFIIDEIEGEGGGTDPDSITIKALSTPLNKKTKTKRCHAHENKTLPEIVNTIAAKNGYRVIGNIEPILIARVSQYREGDFTFLHRLASEYGYAFSIKGDAMVFESVFSLEGRSKSFTVDKTDCMRFNWKDKSFATYNNANVKSHNPNANRVVQSNYTVEQQANKAGIEFSYLKEGETLNIRNKAESEQQANAKTKAALHKANSLQQTMNLELPGNVLILAGNNGELSGFGKLSGIWHVLTSTHTIAKDSGYICSAELKRVIPASVSGSKTKPKVNKVKQKEYTVKTVANKSNIAFNYLELK